MPTIEDAQTKEIDGVKFKKTHTGQKRRYGDTMDEYEVHSDLGFDATKAVLCEKVHKCALPFEKWKAEDTSMDNHFRSYFDIKDYGEGRYFYRVTFPSTH